jgi:hypothetical protein
VSGAQERPDVLLFLGVEYPDSPEPTFTRHRVISAGIAGFCKGQKESGIPPRQ